MSITLNLIPISKLPIDHLIDKDSFISSSYDNNFIINSTPLQFKIIERIQNEFKLLSIGSGGLDGETITSIKVIPLFIPSTGKNALSSIIMTSAIGYSSGFIRIFDKGGLLLFQQQFHSKPLVKIYLNTVLFYDPLLNSTDQLLLQFVDGIVSIIDGIALWISLRNSLHKEGKETLQIQEVPVVPSTNFSMTTQQQINHLFNAGPSTSTLFNQTGDLKSTEYSNRIIGAGTKPCISIYAISQSDFPNPASEMAHLVANSVSNAVTFAKSFFDSPLKDNKEIKVKLDPRKVPHIPSILTISDNPRNIKHLSPSPPSLLTCKSQYLAMPDSLGRVLILNIENGEIVKIIKGPRNAQCGWIPIYKLNNKVITTTLYLIIYSPIRGLLDVYDINPNKKLMSMKTFTGQSLIQCEYGVLGEAYQPKKIIKNLKLFLINQDFMVHEIILLSQ